ncbi:MAG: permease prefix domain 1-containing protein [Lacisediminihabitans sp.]
MSEQQVEAQIDVWRAAILKGRAVNDTDADELEGHLREQISDLESVGLSGDEAFLIAVRRLGQVDVISSEYAQEHGDRLWKQLAVPSDDDGRRRAMTAMFVFAILAAVLVQVARFCAQIPGTNASWLLRDASFFVLPVLAAYFAVVKRMPWRRTLALGLVVVLLAVAVNLFPLARGGSSEVLIGIHLPIVLWFVVGASYLGGDLRWSARRMDFIRFTGEWVIYFTLIALGGGVLMSLTAAILSPIAPDSIGQVYIWVVPSGAAGAIIVAAWLVESKKSVVENLAPVLTAIFTPLFGVMLVAAAVVYTIGGIARDFDRDLLTVFDLLLLVVLGLVVYGLSARDRTRSAGAMDVIRLVAVVAAVVLDILILVSMFARVGEFGLTGNRVAALGLNFILLVNLAVTAWLTARLVAGRVPPTRIERWQTGYLPVFVGWVLIVVLALPPLFSFA